MSLPWSSKGLKVTPIAADELLILDSEDAVLSTKNKRVTLGSLPGTEVLTWTANHDANGFALEDARFADNVDATKILDLNLAGMTTGIVLTIDTNQSTAQTLNIPNIAALDTLVTENFTQTLTNKTLTTPTIASFTNATHDHQAAAGGGTLLSTAALSDTANIAYLNTTNTFGSGLTQIFTHAAGGAGIELAPVAGDVTAPDDGQFWYNLTTNKFRVREDGVTSDMIKPGEIFTWTADHDAAGFDLLNVGGITISNPTDTFQYIVTPAAIVADRILNLPLMTGTDTVVLEAFAATLTNKTITAVANTLTIASTDLTDTANLARSTDNLSFFAATTSAQLAGVISDETGSGLLVFDTSPTIVTPTIASFTNATHDHSNAAGGGNLTNTALTSGVFSAITGVGTQSQALAMGTNNITNVGFFESAATNPADAGAARFGNNQFITWRDVGNTRNARLGLTTGDDLQLDQVDFQINARNDEAANFTMISNFQTPIAGNNLVNIAFRGNNSTPDTFNFAEIDVTARVVTAASEVGEIRFIAANQDTGPGDPLLAINELGVTGVHILNGPLYFTSSSTFPDSAVIIFNNGGGMNLNVEDTGFDFVIGSTFEYFLGPTSADWGSNNLTGMGILEFTSDTGHQISDSVTQLLIDTNTGDDILFREVTTELFKINEVEGLVASRRIQGFKGPDVTSATTITVVDGNMFDITAANTINHMTFTNWQTGSVVTLQFDAAAVVNHNTGTNPANTVSFFLSGSANQTWTAGSTLTVVYDGVVWREVGRSLA